MKEITLMDVLYTGGMIFFIFFGSILLTKILFRNENKEKDRNGQEK